MPDKWEYPWYAAWDLAFHCIPLALVDPDFAKEQLVLLLREWYMHPNGQFPAYEWDLSDANPPVLAWAARRVYEIGREIWIILIVDLDDDGVSWRVRPSQKLVNWVGRLLGVESSARGAGNSSGRS